MSSPSPCCCQLCCYPCFHCEKDRPKKFPHVGYRSPKKASAVTHTPEFYTVPLERIFGSPPEQPQSTHRVIMEQPQRRPQSKPSTGLGQVTEDSTLTFSVYHDIQRSTLQVHLSKASNLPVQKSGKKVFVVTQLDPNHWEIYESKPVDFVANPQFDEVYEFDNLIYCRGNVVFQVYEGYKLSKGNFIGSVVLPLGEADLFGAITTMKIDKSGENLPGDSKGDLLLSLRYDDVGQVLAGTVMKAVNLKKTAVHIVDPYVKVNLLHKGLRQAKWKTSVKTNTRAPVFNESFTFNVSRFDLNELSLEVVLMDYNRFTSNEPMGGVFIGKNAPTESGRSHWTEAVAGYSIVAISRWHGVLPLPV